MSKYTRIDGDYNITSVNPTDNVNVTTHTVTVNGNLEVAGNLTYINVTELNVTDPFILVNASNTGSYSANSGLLTHTSNSTYAGIRYNIGAGDWEISTSTDSAGTSGTWSALATASASSPGAPDTAVQFNVANSFTGSSNFLFDTGNAKLTLTGNLVLGNIASAPSATANSVTLYHNAVGGGDTGVYAKSSSNDGELINYNKAKLLALIL